MCRGQALDKDKQAAQVRRWADMEGKALQTALQGYWPHVQQQVQQVRLALQMTAIQKVRWLMASHFSPLDLFPLGQRTKKSEISAQKALPKGFLPHRELQSRQPLWVVCLI